MIRLVDVNGTWCPVIQCDHCTELITDAGMAAVAWEWSDPSALVFLHKRTCLPFEDLRPWRELTTFLAQLTTNTGSDPRLDPSL